MTPEEPTPSVDPALGDLTELIAAAPRLRWPLGHDAIQSPRSFRVALGQEPIRLGAVEFRILMFLAGRPYHAYTRGAIAAAVTTHEVPVAEEDVDALVSVLRDQLGVLHDYVQTVPYIGYRFKA